MKHAAEILERLEHKPEGITMYEVMEITKLTRYGGQYVMQALKASGIVHSTNRGRGALWRLGKKP